MASVEILSISNQSFTKQSSHIQLFRATPVRTANLRVENVTFACKRSGKDSRRTSLLD